MRPFLQNYLDDNDLTEIFFRIVRYLPIERVVIIDFIDSNELFKLNSELYSRLDFGTPTMIRINSYNQKRVIEGVCYPIKKSLLLELFAKAVQNENSFIIWVNITLDLDSTAIFGKSKSFKFEDELERNLYINGRKRLEDIPHYNGAKYDLVIRNVGQGNWNEIYSEKKIEIIYDIGTSMFHTKEKVREVCIASKEAIKSENPGLIISHWDVDHYHCLFAMEDDVIKSFSYIVCPSYVPTLSSRLILSKFSQLCPNNLFTFELEKNNLRLKYNPLEPIKKGKIIFFFGHYHRDRNKCGVVLAINLANKGAILTGDHFYNQISNCVLPRLISKTHCLIVPHHGGKAGIVEYKLSHNQSVQEAIISVGHNYYGHPFETVITQLKNIGFKIYQTRFKGSDIKITLS